jgi:hypothetical protein
MLLVPRNGEPLEQLAKRISLAAEPSRSLIDGIVAECPRFNVLQQTGKVGHFDAWCKSGAWLEAAFALLAGELPKWSLRRLVKDGGVWFCSLSRSPNMPIEFDDMVEASHEDMALAILLALVEARRIVSVATPVTGVTSDIKATSDIIGDGCYRMSCDNFA